MSRPKRPKRKQAVNINLPIPLRNAAEAYAEANGRALSTLVEDLLRRHLEAKGINADVNHEQVLAMQLSLKSARGPKPRKRAVL